MTTFICEACGHEVDYDELPTEIIDCEECGEPMTGIEDEPMPEDILREAIDAVFGPPRMMDEAECEKFQTIFEED